MDIFSIFLKSNFLIQIIILLLLILSIISWGIIIYQIYISYFITHELVNFKNKFFSGISLFDLYQHSMNHRATLRGIERIFFDGFKKFSESYLIHNHSLQDRLNETIKIMKISIYLELEELETHIVLLDIIAAISPYLGLLGTILSIMNIFIKLGTTQYVVLENIAPGISEALIFIAFGLFVTIPSVIAFYCLNLNIYNIEQKYKIFLEEFSCTLQKQCFLKKIN